MINNHITLGVTMRLNRKVSKETKISRPLSEDGAAGGTGGGAIAAAPSSLFGQKKMIKRLKTTKIPVIKYANDSRKMYEGKLPVKKMTLREFAEKPGATNGFDPADVVSKLQSAEKENNFNQKSVPFGMEDDNGNTVKVYVRPEQADDFENALASMVKDSANSEQEIAEILFKMKDSFDIIHVDWGTLPAEDEGEDLTLNGEGGAGAGEQLPGGEPPAGDEDLTAGGMEGGEPGAEETPPGPEEISPPEEGGEGAVQSSLAAVIDMLKADAEARTAEANAKAKQAEAEQARYAAQIADSKMRSEVEVLDMEDWNKRKEEEKKEAKKLAGLARYRHEQASSTMNDASKAQYNRVPGAGGPVTEI